MGKLSQATLCSEIGWRTYRIHHIVVVMAKVYYGNVISIFFFHNDRVMVCGIAQGGTAFLKTCNKVWSCH